ncbi:MAG: glutamate synthase large subunit [bacterium]
MPKQQGLYDPRFEHDACGVGFVVNIKGERSHQIVEQGIHVLERLSHRGAVGADPLTGDGAGILVQIPHDFFNKVIKKLPERRRYATGLVFLPQEKKDRTDIKQSFEKIVEQAGLSIITWRRVPINDSVIGESARRSMPVIEQPFIARSKSIGSQLEFERSLYSLRRKIEKSISTEGFYIVNLSSRTIIYKGLLMPDQLSAFFPDLSDEDFKSAIALVHSRYSTNTFPSWDLAQPFRFLAHNGEINTLRGNINWMRARGNDVIVPGGSDSASLDNVFELLTLSGRSLAHAMMMLVPAAWENNPLMKKEVRDFYKFHACFMEPWDGPAAVAFTDGRHVGALLDRNGLRPARYIITTDDQVIMASEVGVLDTPPEKIKVSGRLEPGKMFYIDTETNRIVEDDEIKEEIYDRRFYGQWLKENIIDLEALPRIGAEELESLPVETLLKVFGYTREDLRTVIKPMAEHSKEPVGSMGNDTPHAVLSTQPQLLYNYFRQLFAQVTNPAIDPIRESVVMSLETYLGPQQDILSETPAHCHKIQVKEPILTNEQLEKIRGIQKNGFRTKTISLLFSGNMRKALDQLNKEVEQAINKGFSFIILSDRGADEKHLPLPALLAVGSIHHHLIRKALRTKVGLILESAEPREVHHFACLFGYGINLINPYLAYQAIGLLVEQKEIDLDLPTGINNYCHAVEKGLKKILSKMGISTLNSYRGSQIFEALGLADEVIEKCFEGTPSRIGGAGFAEIEKETLLRHEKAFSRETLLDSGGVYQWRKDGEFHLWRPESISAIQDAARNNDYSRYLEFAELINNQEKQPTTLRSLLKFKPSAKLISIAEVEPIESIMKRFVTGAMSFGSISGAAHETMAKALNEIGGRSNTGEGGEEPSRFADDRRSAIKQVASGRFGVTTNYLVNADELQIKVAQGAKPGEGGQLPGHKVSAIIAKTRYTTPGVTLISPPPHHDIYSIEDLAQLIFDLKNVNPRARISVKLVSEVGVGTVAAGVAKGHADMILISGGDGGTGASPLSSIRYAGLPWELGLAETHQTLVLNDLRTRVRLQTDGQLRTGKDIAVAAMLGAEEYGFATIALIICGCVMLRHCHLNNCSLGVATQDAVLAKRFQGKPEYLVNYFKFLAQDLREIMAQLGVRSIDELIGRTDLLEVNKSILPWKAKKLDFSRILWEPQNIFCTQKQEHGLEKILDQKLIKLAKPALENKKPVKEELAIHNFNRTTGGMLSGELCKRFGEAGLPDDTIFFKFTGNAGQSFGAWLMQGITFELDGLANDYIGKGMFGGKIIVKGSAGGSVIGNTTFYGAIRGEAYIRGEAGERFCIRNSGLKAVVEGVGDHGCEYMTGGNVVILGSTGRNFAAGMSGGIAYVYDRNGEFSTKCNLEMVALEELDKEDLRMTKELLSNHFKYTRSPLARQVLDNFKNEIRRFVKVMPIEYKRVLEERALTEKERQQQMLEVA